MNVWDFVTDLLAVVAVVRSGAKGSILIRFLGALVP